MPDGSLADTFIPDQSAQSTKNVFIPDPPPAPRRNVFIPDAAPADAAASQASFTPDQATTSPPTPSPSLADMIVSGETQGAPVPTLSQTVAPPAPSPGAAVAPTPPPADTAQPATTPPDTTQPDTTQLVQDPTTGQVSAMPFTPQPWDPRPGVIAGLTAGAQAAVAGGNRLFGGTFTPQPVDQTERTPGGQLAYNLAFGAPVPAAGVLGFAGGTALTGGPWGGIAGSGVAMAATAAAQSLAPAYDQARQQGLSHEDAVNRAIETAAVSGGISGLSAPLYALAPFRLAISNILLHTFVTAPALGTTERLTVPAVTGQPMPSLGQLGEGALTDVATGALLSGAHAVGRELTQSRFPSITPTGAVETPGQGPPAQGELAPPQAQLPPPEETTGQTGAQVDEAAPKPEQGLVEPDVSPDQAKPSDPSPSTEDAAVDTAAADQQPSVRVPLGPVVRPPVGDVTPLTPDQGTEQGSSDQAPSSSSDTTKTQAGTPTEGAPGSTRTVATAQPGVDLPTTYQVVEADTLKPATGDLQPRDRAGRVPSEAQIAENASRLDPGQITASPVADYGAPVVMPDGTVLAGNGRLAAIQRAAELHPEKYQAYVEALNQLGHDTTGMTQPVLVRRTGDLTPDQARGFAEASNVPRAMAMSPVEQAKVDARNLSPGTLAKYNPDVALTHGANAGFIRDWMQSLPPTERNRMVDAQGQMSAEGLRRLQGAVLAKAYEHDGILKRALESPADDIKSITNSLMDVAAPWVKLREETASGRLPDAFNITDKLTQALDLIQQARAKGQSPGDIIRQQDVFTGAIDPVTEQLVRTFYNDRMDRLRSRKGITDTLRGYVDEALAFRPGKDLLGEEATPNPVDALQRAREGGQGGLLSTLAEPLARSERMTGQLSGEFPANRDYDITVNPTAQQLARMLSGADRVQGLRAIVYGNDVVVADAHKSIHADIRDALRDNAHPLAEQRQTQSMRIRPDREGGPSVVTDAQGNFIPREQWPEALRRALPERTPAGEPATKQEPQDEQSVLDAAFANTPTETSEGLDTTTARSPELQSELDDKNTQIAAQQKRIAELEAKGAKLTAREARTLRSLKRQNALAVRSRDQLAKRIPRGGPAPVQRRRFRLVSPFKPKPPQAPKDYTDYQFRDGTSVARQAFTDAGHDPNLAVNKPIAWQIQTLKVQTQKQFGLTSVEIAPGMDHLQTRNILLDVYRASTDAMASMGYPTDGLGLGKTVGLVLEPYTPKAEYAGMYDPSTRMIHLTGTANSLGHEWIHALDHWLLDQLPILKMPNMKPLASVHTAEGMLGNPNESITERFSKVLVTLFHDDAELALRMIHLERAAAQTDAFGNPTPAAVTARGELDDLRHGMDTGTVKASRLREMSVDYGGGPGVDDYYGSVYEMVARSGEAVLARMMEDNAVDPRGVVMESGAYLNALVRRLRMTYPKDDEYLRVYESWKLLHSAIQNKLFYDAPGGPFSDPKGTLDLKKVSRLARRAPPGALRALRHAIMESATALRHPIESWRSVALTDPTRPDAGDRTWLRRTANFGRQWFYTKIGALDTMHAFLPEKSGARAPLQAIIDKLGITPGSGRSVPRTYEERAYFLAKDWTRQFVNIMANNGLTPKDFTMNRLRQGEDWNAMLRHALVTGEDSYRGKPIPANIKAAAGSLRELSNAVFKSNQDAGMDIFYAKSGHFMRMYDHPAVWADNNGFKSDAHKLHTLMFNQDVGSPGDDPAALLKRWRDLSVEERGLIDDPQVGTDMQKLARNLVRQRDITRELNDPGSNKDKAALAQTLQDLKDTARQLAEQHHAAVGHHIANLASEAWLSRILIGYPDDFDTVGPSGAYLNKRVLPPEADTIMAKWMVTDVNTVMPRYYMAAARKQASIELFGARDAEFERLLKEAAENGLHGEDARVVRAMKQAITGRPMGASHGFGVALNWLHAFSTVTMLGRTALTMASEPLVAGLSTGDVRVALKTMLHQLGAVMKTADSRDRAELADLVNVTTSALYDDAMLNRTGADYADSLQLGKLVGMYYRLNLMTQWNNSTRRASMAAHNWYLTKILNDWGHYEDTYNAPGGLAKKGYAYARAHTKWDRANRMLNEIGVPTDMDTRRAFAAWMVSHDGLPSYEELNGGSNFAPIYQTAIIRLVDRAVMNPKKADRPLIADSPYGLMMQFQSFNYAMGRNVVIPMYQKINDDMARAYDRARGQGYSKTAAGAQAAGAAAMSTMNLALVVAAFVGATMLTAAVKLALYANDVYQRHLDDDTLLEYLRDYAMNQAGLAGALTMPMNLYNDIRYSSSLGDAFNGPGLAAISEGVRDIMLAFTGENTPDTATNTHYFNGVKAAYNMVVVPLEAYALSKLAGGFGPIVHLLGTLGFASLSSRPFADRVAETFFGPKGAKPEADQDGELQDRLTDRMSEGTGDEAAAAKGKPQEPGAGGGGPLFGVLDDYIPPIVRAIGPYVMSMPGPAKLIAAAGLAAWGGISFWNTGAPYRNAPPPGAKGEP